MKTSSNSLAISDVLKKQNQKKKTNQEQLSHGPGVAVAEISSLHGPPGTYMWHVHVACARNALWTHARAILTTVH